VEDISFQASGATFARYGIDDVERLQNAKANLEDASMFFKKDSGRDFKKVPTYCHEQTFRKATEFAAELGPEHPTVLTILGHCTYYHSLRYQGQLMLMSDANSWGHRRGLLGARES